MVSNLNNSLFSSLEKAHFEAHYPLRGLEQKTKTHTTTSYELCQKMNHSVVVIR
jgi:hypothetical protein